MSNSNAAHNSELQAARKVSFISRDPEDRMVCVISSHPLAAALGFEFAPVVVVFNTAAAVDRKNASKGKYIQFTVSRNGPNVKFNLSAVLLELQVLEPGWGGQGDSLSSIPGVSSKLTLDQVREVVSRHISHLVL